MLSKYRLDRAFESRLRCTLALQNRECNGENELARKTHYQGNVVLRSVVDDQGVPTQIKIMKPLGMCLDEAAVNCVEQWRFAPANRDDKPVAVEVDIEVNFKLIDAAADAEC